MGNDKISPSSFIGLYIKFKRDHYLQTSFWSASCESKINKANIVCIRNLLIITTSPIRYVLSSFCDGGNKSVRKVDKLAQVYR